MTVSPEVLVYYKPGCPFAARLRAGLTVARITYRLLPLRDNEDAAARVRDANGGNEVSPTVLVRTTCLTNPSVRTVQAALRQAESPAPAKPSGG